MIANAKVQATLRTLTAIYATPALTVVPVPPSAADAAAGVMRVYIGGALCLEPYDPVLEQP